MLIDLYSKSSRSSRMALMAAVAIIAIVGSYDKFIHAHVQCLEAAQKYSDEMSSFSQKNKTLESRLKIQQIDVDNLAAKTSRMQEQIFSAFAAQQFFAGLELIARENTCVVTSLNQHDVKNKTDEANTSVTSGISAQRASITILGDYSNIVRFLNQIVDRPNKVIVDPFTMLIRRDSSDLVECSMIISIYVMNDENGKGADPNAR